MSNSNKPHAFAPDKNRIKIPDITIRKIEANRLISSQDYQRTVNQPNVKYIKENYEVELVNPIKVSLRNGKYYVFDGQHTLAVLIEMFGEKCIVPCIIYTGLTYEREAMLFAKQDDGKKKLYSREILKGKLEGNDKEIVEFTKICTDLGFTCNFKPNANAPLVIGNYQYMVECYRKKGKDHLVELLTIIKTAYPDEASAMSNDFIKGLDMFITLYRGEYSIRDLVMRLQKYNPLVIVRNGRCDTVHKGAARYAQQIYDVYNKNLKCKLRVKI